MTEWFDQRYISREEHRQIVEYYRKQVAGLYHDLCELRMLVRTTTISNANPHGGTTAGRERTEPQNAGGRDNVICVDFRRARENAQIGDPSRT